MNYGESQAIITISAIMKKGQTHYITPHPKTMTDLLKKFHDRDISLQTYWRNMKDLEDEGYISRQSRWNTQDKKQPRRRPSMIALTIKGAKYLYKMGVAWAGQVLGAMLKWAKKGDKRFPQKTEVIYVPATGGVPIVEMSDEFYERGTAHIHNILAMLEAK